MFYQYPASIFHSREFSLDSFFHQALSSNHKQVLTAVFPSNLILPKHPPAEPGFEMLTSPKVSIFVCGPALLPGSANYNCHLGLLSVLHSISTA